MFSWIVCSLEGVLVMGFEAKILVLSEEKGKADEIGKNGETEYVVWSDSFLTIYFGHVTRLEKVVGERFKHLTHTSFRRAGICVVDCFLDKLFTNFDNDPFERLAPEIIVHRDLWNEKLSETFPEFREDDLEESLPDDATKLIGGNIYMDCSEYRLLGEMRNSKIIDQHNKAIRMDLGTLNEYLRSHHIFMNGPLMWTSCAELATWLSEAEVNQTEAWKALVKDQLSLAIAKGFRHQLRELGEVGARALFRFC